MGRLHFSTLKIVKCESSIYISFQLFFQPLRVESTSSKVLYGHPLPHAPELCLIFFICYCMSKKSFDTFFIELTKNCAKEFLDRQNVL